MCDISYHLCIYMHVLIGIYMNTIYKTFRQIKEMEEGVRMQEEDKGEFVEVKIVIPKNKR